MSSPAFTLQVPSEAPYRALSGDIAARYVEVVGGAATVAASLAAAVRRAADQLADGAGPTIDLTFTRGPEGIEVVLTSGAETRRLTASL